MADHWLYDRGLGSQIDPLSTDQPDTVWTVADLPRDYVARVEALRVAIEWSRIHDYPTPEQTLRRALDFHAFLMGREQKEPVQTDE